MSDQVQGEEVNFLVEESQPKARNLLPWGIGIILVFVTISFVISTIFYQTVAKKRQEQVLSKLAPGLKAARDAETKKINSFGTFTQEGKTFAHVPVSQAIEMEAEAAKSAQGNQP